MLEAYTEPSQTFKGSVLDASLDSEYVSLYENKFITKVWQRRSTQYKVKYWITCEFLLWNSEYKSRELWTRKLEMRIFEKICIGKENQNVLICKIMLIHKHS